MNVPTVSVLNHSTVLTETEIQAALPAFQEQVDRDFSYYWHTSCQLVFGPHRGAWTIVVLDDSDQANALGYHGITHAGRPLGKVFAKTDQENGLAWTVTFSHELLEMLADPDINQARQVTDTDLYACEIADPVEDDAVGYAIDGIQVTDFITPAWFVPGRRGPFDCRRHLSHPLQLLPGGYASIFVSGQGWTQVQEQHGQLVTIPLELDNPRFRKRG